MNKDEERPAATTSPETYVRPLTTGELLALSGAACEILAELEATTHVRRSAGYQLNH